MLTVVEYYLPWWSDRELPRPAAFTNRNAAIKSATHWASQLAVDKLGSFNAYHLNNDKDMDFVVVYEDEFGTNSNEVALLFDVEVVH